MFFIDATSLETISSSLKGSAKAADLEENPNDVLEWLASQNKRWLLVFDNADDPKIDLGNYFPKCTTGDIVITSKNNQMKVHANGEKPHCCVQEMGHDEAKTLLLERADLEDSEEVRTDLNNLLKASFNIPMCKIDTNKKA